MRIRFSLIVAQNALSVNIFGFILSKAKRDTLCFNTEPITLPSLPGMQKKPTAKGDWLLSYLEQTQGDGSLVRNKFVKNKNNGQLIFFMKNKLSVMSLEL